MAPLGELSVSIPVGLAIYKMNPVSVYNIFVLFNNGDGTFQLGANIR